MSVRDGSIKCHLADIKVAGASIENSMWSTLACELLNGLINEHRGNLCISKKVNTLYITIINSYDINTVCHLLYLENP